MALQNFASYLNTFSDGKMIAKVIISDGVSSIMIYNGEDPSDDVRICSTFMSRTFHAMREAMKNSII